MSAETAPFPVPPVVKRATVPLPVEAAFDRFTAGIGGWWPLATHSISKDDGGTIVIEPRLGGRLIERDRNGNEHLWGTIVRWDPPHSLAFTWHVGRAPETAQTVELRFAESGSRGTQVTLVHSGWEKLGDDAKAARDSYDGGWEQVLCRNYANVEGGN